MAGDRIRNVQVSRTPADRLARIADAGLAAMRDHPDYRGDDRLLAVVEVPEHRIDGEVDGMLGAWGFEDGREIISVLYDQIRAICRRPGMVEEVLKGGSDEH